MKTFSPKPSDITREWHIIDAATAPLGRLSTQVATLLTGKGKPTYAPHLDSGDFVVIINADSLVVTGNKAKDKMYYHHSGFPGGLRERTLTEQKNLDSSQIIIASVKGMLPKNKLQAERLKRLKVYSGAEHPHAGQQPKEFQVNGAKK